jgi:hypothetical protein
MLLGSDSAPTTGMLQRPQPSRVAAALAQKKIPVICNKWLVNLYIQPLPKGWVEIERKEGQENGNQNLTL